MQYLSEYDRSKKVPNKIYSLIQNNMLVLSIEADISTFPFGFVSFGLGFSRQGFTVLKLLCLQTQSSLLFN